MVMVVPRYSGASASESLGEYSRKMRARAHEDQCVNSFPERRHREMKLIDQHAHVNGRNGTFLHKLLAGIMLSTFL